MGRRLPRLLPKPCWRTFWKLLLLLSPLAVEDRLLSLPEESHPAGGLCCPGLGLSPPHGDTSPDGKQKENGGQRKKRTLILGCCQALSAEEKPLVGV